MESKAVSGNRLRVALSDSKVYEATHTTADTELWVRPRELILDKRFGHEASAKESSEEKEAIYAQMLQKKPCSLPSFA